VLEADDVAVLNGLSGVRVLRRAVRALHDPQIVVVGAAEARGLLLARRRVAVRVQM
jgi:hypothetical protein